ncbi:hypothetical protein ACJRO7_028158 [Eucalyptus globulus]|uniref:Leucine-rich repeat-containing N-terminal plant-type domain-containing protein n=1 Tax=Eucalyptus globulus TaxID=34317 RepID=A0ABD3JW51_EUCGL
MASYFYTNFVPTLLDALFIFLALEFCYPHALTNVNCIGAEREALLKFKQDLIDPSRNLSSWTGKHCCEWEGVKCNHRTSHVSQLNLIGRGLGGKIDLALSELRRLKYLRLGNNNFNGHMPNQCGNFKHLEFLSLSHNSILDRIPSNIVQLASLRYLDFSYNNLSGNILESIGQHRNLELMHFILKFLSLSHYSISGHIPSTIGQLSSLRILDLSHNNLSGNIPESIWGLYNLEVINFGHNRLDGVIKELHLANLTNLIWLSLNWNDLVINVSASWVPPFQIKTIDLSNCKVGPEFPIWIQTQRNILILYLSNASILGEVPHWLPDILSNIEFLDLSGNMIRGNISEIFVKKVPQLKMLLLSANNFSGDIPKSLCMSHELVYLDLSKNQLSGRLPQCLGMLLNSLQWISLRDNKLNGQIPSSLCGLKHLKVLGLHKNGLNGVLPKCLLKQDLAILDLSDNLFTGRIPPFSSRLFGVIDLSKNYFTGDIPLQLCQLHKLQYLSLAHNNLSGVIPPCFSNFSQMWANSTNTLYLDEMREIPIMVNIKRTSLEFTSSLRYLFSIDLSSNTLQGQIPEGLNRLAQLQNLNLSRNKLIGKIPSDIGNLRYLESLDLSNNKLSGEIPSSISRLDFLSCMDFSFNNLSGHIPSGSHLSTLEDQSVYRGNNGLCGAPLLKVCPGDEYNEMERQYDHNSNEDESNEGGFVVNWFYSGSGSGFAVALMGFCGILHVNQTWRIYYFQTLDRIIKKLLIGRLIIMVWFKGAFQFQLCK